MTRHRSGQHLDDRTLSEALLSPYSIQVRRRVFKQLIESLLFEQVIIPKRVHRNEEIHFYLQGRDNEGQTSIYRCTGQERFTFGRISLSEATIVRMDEKGNEHEADDIHLFLHELFGDGEAQDYHLRRFIMELTHTITNDTLSQYICNRDVISNSMDRSYDEWESVMIDGHPYHPCYKSRIGFNIEDHVMYGPEFASELKLVWLAVLSKDVRVYGMEEASYQAAVVSELAGLEMNAFHSIIRTHGDNPSDYTMIPVHPWQWRNAIVFQFASEIAKRQLIYLGESEHSYRPQQSIRTLVNATDIVKASVKLSLHITNSSTLRDLRPHSIAAAPVVSTWLRKLIDADEYLKKEARLIILLEFAGACYDPPNHQAMDGQESRQGLIGCIWRESLIPYLEVGEEAVPFNLLTARQGNGKPYMDTWMQKYGIMTWLRAVIERCIVPVVHLFVAHGLALESHAQNMIMVHRDGLPVRTALKDFHEGVEYCDSFLADSSIRPDFASLHEVYEQAVPGDFFDMGSLNSVREMTLDALFHMNLGELAIMLKDEYDVSEQSFWLLVLEILEQHIQNNPSLRDRWIEAKLTVQWCTLECLTKRKLFPDRSDLNHEKPNPLYHAELMRLRQI